MTDANYLLHSLIQKSGFILGVVLAEAKPCPFCGGRAYLQYDIRYPRPNCEPTQAYEIFCSNEDCIMFNQDGVYFTDKEDALEAWNTRK